MLGRLEAGAQAGPPEGTQAAGPEGLAGGAGGTTPRDELGCLLEGVAAALAEDAADVGVQAMRFDDSFRARTDR